MLHKTINNLIGNISLFIFSENGVSP